MGRIAVVYAKDASSPVYGMDLIRWRQMSRCLADFGHEVDLVTDRPSGVSMLDGLPVCDTAEVSWDRYDAVKVCYQHSIDLVPPHPNIIVRMCRVVDADRPARDALYRKDRLRQQDRVAALARFVAVNDEENARRWRRLHGDRQEILLVPTGCPQTIPPPGTNPFPAHRRIVLFCGSLSSPRFVTVLNRLGRLLPQLGDDLQLHIVGRNRLHLYGGTPEPLDERVVHVHDPVDEREAWPYIMHAHVGLALAASADRFENELAKIYYYLRGGLPVVVESSVLNRHLIEETGHGAVAQHDDPRDLMEKIDAALKLPPHREEVMAHMVRAHSWRCRAQVYVDALARARDQRGPEVAS